MNLTALEQAARIRAICEFLEVDLDELASRTKVPKKELHDCGRGTVILSGQSIEQIAKYANFESEYFLQPFSEFELYLLDLRELLFHYAQSTLLRMRVINPEV